MSPLVISTLEDFTFLFSFTTFKIDLQGVGVTWTTRFSPYVQWNPVNTVTNEPKKFDSNNE